MSSLCCVRYIRIIKNPMAVQMRNRVHLNGGTTKATILNLKNLLMHVLWRTAAQGIKHTKGSMPPPHYTLHL